MTLFLLYFIFAMYVAIYKTYTYINIDIWTQFRNAPVEQRKQIVILTFSVTFVIAPLTFIELVYEYIKNKIKTVISKIKTRKRRKRHEQN